jgi:hypothetical protein
MEELNQKIIRNYNLQNLLQREREQNQEEIITDIKTDQKLLENKVNTLQITLKSKREKIHDLEIQKIELTTNNQDLNHTIIKLNHKYQSLKTTTDNEINR